ncbi:MAG: hypothetical protein GY702_29305 [Desulfobulbaceae bacterium]|nr:hypothetical protein [Desulfobulbaceae bacterium]
MMIHNESLPSYVAPSNKFYPPHIDPSQSLLRSTLLSAKMPSDKHEKKAIIIEAQAGQGKTTLISQFLDVNKLTYIWYQVGPEDSDPILLLSSLLLNLHTNLNGFNSPDLENILSKGSVGPLDLPRCANILLQDLDNHLKNDIYLVFDDLYLVEFGALTNKLLEYLLDTSPPKVHFIFITRHPLEIKGKTIRNGSQIAYLNTRDLALNNEEIETLYNSVLGKDITGYEAAKIQKVTNGWIMGIILASHPISGRSKFWLDPEADKAMSATTGHMLDYFQDEIFAQIPENLHTIFLKLSILQEIPADLATLLSGVENFGHILSHMTRENYFIYNLDDNEQVYRLHHFFQEFLQERAREQFSADDINDIYAQEARYYLERELTEKALTCFKNGGDFESMEAILKEKGMELIARNRTFTILTLLQTIPDETLYKYAWLVLYSGLLRVDFVPQTTLPFWNAARKAFIKSKEETGELIALCQTIYFHFVISGDYIEGAKILSRTETLFEKNRETLPVPIVIMAARNLSSGYCFFQSDMDKARHYIGIASRLAARQEVRNFIAASRFIKGYIELLSGNRAKYLREAEVCFSLFNDPLVGESNRLTMRIMNLCYLSMTGDHQNFRIQQLALQNSIETTVVDQTVAAPYLFVWGSSNLYSIGRPQQGLELIERGLGVTSTAATNHMHSQLLQWQAFGLALTGYNDEAVEKITRSNQLREAAGGPFYIAFNYIVTGAVYTRAKMYEEARNALEQGLAIAQTIPSTFLTICALFNISYFRLKSEGSETAIDELEAGLALMKINGFNHFWTWEPKMMSQLLTLAVHRDIEKSFAKNLAKTRLQLNISGQGVHQPLLKFTLLDTFSLSIAGQTLFHAKDFTPFQRELLGLLITAKGQRIPQEKIQLELWPESSPENARKSFDTLLTRLRKLISPTLPSAVKKYLYLQKGILCLTSYEIDSLSFLEAARTGLSHSKNSDWWQAHNAFQHALLLWQGSVPEDAFQSEQVLDFNDMLTSLLVEVGITWSDNLADSGRIEEAISILERVLQINYLEAQLTSRLYHYLIRASNPLRAKEVIERYRKALRKADYSAQDASDYIDEIVQNATSN